MFPGDRDPGCLKPGGHCPAAELTIQRENDEATRKMFDSNIKALRKSTSISKETIRELVEERKNYEISVKAIDSKLVRMKTSGELCDNCPFK